MGRMRAFSNGSDFLMGDIMGVMGELSSYADECVDDIMASLAAGGVTVNDETLRDDVYGHVDDLLRCGDANGMAYMALDDDVSYHLGRLDEKVAALVGRKTRENRE